MPNCFYEICQLATLDSMLPHSVLTEKRLQLAESDWYPRVVHVDELVRVGDAAVRHVLHAAAAEVEQVVRRLLLVLVLDGVPWKLEK